MIHPLQRIQQKIPYVVFLSLGLLLFPAPGRDDAYISYWAAKILAASGHITNYNGEPVEQSSSLLQTLLLAGIHRISNIDIVTLGHISSILFGLLGLAALSLLAKRIEPTAIAGSVWLVSLSPFYLYWSFGGMETSLTASTLILLLVLYLDYLSGTQELSLGILTITTAALLARPEIFLIILTALLAAITVLCLQKNYLSRHSLHSTSVIPHLYSLLLMTSGVQSLIFLTRKLYFHDWFPQPVTAKTNGLSFERAYRGLAYLYHTLDQSPYHLLFTIGIGVGLILYLRQVWSPPNGNPALLLPLAFASSYTLFVILSGGDWMEGGRFLVPVWPICIMLAWIGISRKIFSRKTRLALLSAMLLLEGLSSVSLAYTDSTSIPLWYSSRQPQPIQTSYIPNDSFSWFIHHNRVSIRDIPVIEEIHRLVTDILQQDNRETPLWIMSHQMGIVSYYLSQEFYGSIRLLDMYGLTDRYFTTCPVTRLNPRTVNGLQVSYRYFFDHLTSLQRECNLPKPDLIFDLFSDKQEVEYITSQGYAPIYIQEGYIRPPSSLLPGSTVVANQFIAVREDYCTVVDCTLYSVSWGLR